MKPDMLMENAELNTDSIAKQFSQPEPGEEVHVHHDHVHQFAWTPTRRGLIAPAVTAVMASVLPAPTAIARPVHDGYDAVIVGAGYAGLAAARRLMLAGKSVIVLEAQDRVGGRTLNESIGGGAITELGAGYVGPTQDELLKLAQNYGVETFPVFNCGNNVYFTNGQRFTYPFGSPFPTTWRPKISGKRVSR